MKAKINDVNNSNAGLFETRNNQLDWTCYTKNQSYPTNVQLSDILTVTYYDDYLWTDWRGPNLQVKNNSFDTYFATPSNTQFPYPQPLTQSTATKGFVTGTGVNPIGNSYNLVTIIYYDDKGRVIQTRSDNSSANNDIGFDFATTQYSWSGQPLQTVQQHQKAGTNAQTHIVITKMDYDDLGRVIKTRKKINSTPETTIADLAYDRLGQLKTKQVGKIRTSSDPLNYNYTANPIETLTYDYNIRGWMLGINRSFINDALTRKFGFELAYDKTTHIIAGQLYSNAQYNGNIAGMTWKSTGDNEKRKYDFTYDAVNRLEQANFTQFTSGSFNVNAGVDFTIGGDPATGGKMKYDANGNILQMWQKGWKITGSDWIDKMNYNYIANSNKLLNVIDGINDPQTKLGDFRTSTLHPVQTKTITTVDYTYDANGNLKKDLNKDIGTSAAEDIVYNHLNLPQSITVRTTGGAIKGTITYTYDAAGNKLKKVTVENASAANGNKTITTTTSYISGFIYESKTTVPANNPNNDYTDRLQFTGHEEGRIRALYTNTTTPNTITGFAYDYMLKDHLGNVRMVLTDEIKNNIYPPATLEPATVTCEGNNFYLIESTKIWDKSQISGLPAYANDNEGLNAISNPCGASGNSNKMYRLFATSAGAETGLGITLKVMAGDKIDIHAKSYYTTSNSSQTNYSVPILQLFTGFLGGSGAAIASAKGATPSLLNSNTSLVNAVNNNHLNDPARGGGTQPKAYINWILFDEQFKFVTGGFSRVNTNANSLKDHINELRNIPISKNGFVYIYISNESPVAVFFDNLQVVHKLGPLVEETHYYPFGLSIAGISSQVLPSNTPNRKKYNGIEQNNDFDLCMYDAFYRNLDPQIGRFWQIDPEIEAQENYSPYESMGNNPISYVDPLGDFKNRFGAWLYNLWHYSLGGSVSKNKWGEWQVTYSHTSGNNTNVSVQYGAGRNKYSNAIESLSRGYDIQDDIQKKGKNSMYTMYETEKEAGNAAVNITAGVILPNPVLRTGTITVNAAQLANTGKKIIEGIRKTISVQKQARHLTGTAKQGGGFLNSAADAQKVLDAVHSGEAVFLGTTKAGQPVFRYSGVTGTNVNVGAGVTSQPTNVFIIKGTTSPSVVPTSPAF